MLAVLLNYPERNVCFLKRIASGVLALIFTLALMLPGAAFASEPPETTTPYICLMDANTGSVLYEKSAAATAAVLYFSSSVSSYIFARYLIAIGVFSFEVP